MAEATTAPLIETARLRLRGFLLSDLEAHVAILADPLVYRGLSGAPTSREEAWRRLIGSFGLWALLGYGYWAVERKSDGRFIGQAGFGDFKRDITPGIEGLPEMGWIFASEVHGQGYASEAVTAALAWADETISGKDYVAVIAPDNDASIRLARRSGFVLDREAAYKDEMILIFRRPSRR